MISRYSWVVITYILTQLSTVAFTLILFKQFNVTEIQASAYGSVIGFVAGLIVILLILKSERTNFPRDGASPLQILIWSILGVFMAYIAQIIAVNIEIHVFGIKTTSENTAVLMDIIRMAPIFVIIPTIIAPILEEIVFRKVIFGAIYKRTNFFIGAAASSLIFALIHGEPKHLLIYASMGFVFAFVYVKTKRIIVPIIVHMAMNTITVIMQYSFTPEDLENMQKQLEEMFIFIGG